MENCTKKYKKNCYNYNSYDVQPLLMELDKRNDKQTVILQNLLPWKASYTTVPKDK